MKWIDMLLRRSGTPRDPKEDPDIKAAQTESDTVLRRVDRIVDLRASAERASQRLSGR